MTIEKLFEGQEGLTPEFKEKVTTIFEAAVTEAVNTQLAAKLVEITESSDQKLETAIKEATSNLTSSMEIFLEEAVNEWAKENAVGIDSKLKTEIAESFIEGLKDIFTKHNVQIDEATKVTVTELEGQVQTLTEKATTLEGELKTIKEGQSAAERASVLKVLTEGLVETSVERVKKVLESMTFKDDEDFKTKAGFIVEAMGVKIVAESGAADLGADGKPKKKDDKDGKDGKKYDKDGNEIVNENDNTVVDQTLAYFRKGR